MTKEKELTGYPSIDKPWLKYYGNHDIDLKITDVNVFRFLYEGNKEYRNQPALVYFDRKISYNTLFENIEQCAKSFWSLGIREGDIVTIQSLSVPQVVYAFYALGYIGAIANIIYVTDGEDELRESLNNTNSKMYIVLDAIYEKNKNALKDSSVNNTVVLSLGSEADYISKTVIGLKMHNKIAESNSVMSWKNFIRLGEKDVRECRNASLPAAIIYTSGTTGKTKGVVLSNKAINALAIQYKYGNFGFKRGETFFNSLPQFIAFGLVMSLHVPLSLGITNILVPDPTAAKVGGKFAKYKPNYFVNGMAAVESIIENKKIINSDLSYIKVFAVGGDKIPVTFEEYVNNFLEVRNSKSKLLIGYGMTEVAATVITHSNNAYKIGTVGIPLPMTNVKIVEYGSEKELGYNEEGEICFYAPTMMNEYYKHPDETNEILREHSDGLIWVHSGDMGTVDENGFVKVVGRYKRMITLEREGIYHKVFPQLIEDRLTKELKLDGVEIVGKKVDKGVNELIAFIQYGDESTWEDMCQKIDSYVNSNLEVWECPSTYIRMDRFPRTQIGKVDHRELEKMAEKKGGSNVKFY